MLTIVNGESLLDDALLARAGASDPLGAATTFIQARGFQGGETIQVTGQNGAIGGVAVIFITAVQAFAAAARATLSRSRKRARKTTTTRKKKTRKAGTVKNTLKAKTKPRK
jgi:hypothetical protein